MGFSLKKIGSALGTVAGAVVGGPVGSVVGNVLGAQNEAKANYKWQLGQETANNIALWNMQNAYNTPKAQMERFKEAGLNPNLIYGQTNTATPISTASANLDYGNTMSQKTLGNYLALSNLGIQKDLSSAQVRNIDNSINMSKENLEIAKQRVKLDRDRLNLDRDIADSGLIGQYIGRRQGGQLNAYVGNLIQDWLKEKGYEF